MELIKNFETNGVFAAAVEFEATHICFGDTHSILCVKHGGCSIIVRTMT